MIDSYDVFIPYKFSITQQQINEIKIQALRTIDWCTNSGVSKWKFWFTPKHGLSGKEQIYKHFPMWNLLETEIQKHLDITYDFDKRCIEMFEFKQTVLGLLTEMETALLIPLGGELSVHYEIIDHIQGLSTSSTERITHSVLKGTIVIQPGDVLFVKPHTYVYSSQPQTYLLLIISPEKKACMYMFSSSVYDPVFQNKMFRNMTK